MRHYKIANLKPAAAVDQEEVYHNKMIKMTDINEAANGGGSLAAAPQAQVPPEDELPVSDENVGSDRNLEKKCIKFGRTVGGFYHRAIAAWPRTSALTFGVVVPLFLLIAVSVFFGE